MELLNLISLGAAGIGKQGLKGFLFLFLFYFTFKRKILVLLASPFTCEGNVGRTATNSEREKFGSSDGDGD